MKEQLSSFLVLEGFTPVSTNVDDFLIFLKKETGHVTALFVLNVPANDAFTGERFRQLRDSALNLLRIKDFPEIHYLFLAITEDVEGAVSATDSDRNAWILRRSTYELVIPSDRVEDFYGMKGQLLTFLKDPGRADALLEDVRKNLYRVAEAKKKADEAKAKESIPWVSIVLIALNLIVLGICVFFGEPVYAALDLDPKAIFERHQWYRIFTYMYVHSGVSHYLSNMVMLYFNGNFLEKPLGRVRYAILYHILGMLAGLGSLAFKVMMDSDVPSVGASGAIMGLMGIIVYISIRNVRFQQRGGINRIMILIFCVFCSIYQGFMVPGVDNAAHIAGMAAGIFAGLIWELMIRRREKK